MNSPLIAPPKKYIKPMLSLAIGAINEPHLLGTIASARATAGDKVEIVVVDDASDKPIDIPSEYNVVLIRNQERIGAGASKHKAAIASTGTHVCLLDSHMVFENGWYEKAMARISPTERWNVVHCGSCRGLDSEDMHLEEFHRNTTFAQVRDGQRCVVNNLSGRKLSEDQFRFTKEERQIPSGRKVPHGQFITTTVNPETPAMIHASPGYYGAQLNIVGLSPNNPDEFQCFDGVWAGVKPSPHKSNQEYNRAVLQRTDWMQPDFDDYELSCLMGACYFFSRKWYDYIGGLNGNKFWGSEEPSLSLKTYLAGGSVRIMKGVRIGHKFHSGSIPYQLLVWWKNYNKVRSIMTTMNECETKMLLPHLSKQQDIKVTMEQIRNDRKEIEDEYRYNQAIFVRDLTWFCKRFGIRHPLEK